MTTELVEAESTATKLEASIRDTMFLAGSQLAGLSFPQSPTEESIREYQSKYKECDVTLS